jgi:hypothetical protein
MKLDQLNEARAINTNKLDDEAWQAGIDDLELLAEVLNRTSKYKYTVELIDKGQSAWLASYGDGYPNLTIRRKASAKNTGVANHYIVFRGTHGKLKEVHKPFSELTAAVQLLRALLKEVNE